MAAFSKKPDHGGMTHEIPHRRGQRPNAAAMSTIAFPLLIRYIRSRAGINRHRRRKAGNPLAIARIRCLAAGFPPQADRKKDTDSTMLVVVIFVTDILYQLIDPRVRVEEKH